MNNNFDLKKRCMTKIFKYKIKHLPFQSPTREAGKGGHGHDTSTSVGAGSQPWRWTALTSGGAAAAGQPQVSCGPSAVTQHQAAAAVQAASLHAGSAAGGVTAGQLTGTPAAANHHLATQPGLNYAAQVI